jgi:hypothetical protein
VLDLLQGACTSQVRTFGVPTLLQGVVSDVYCGAAAGWQRALDQLGLSAEAGGAPQRGTDLASAWHRRAFHQRDRARGSAENMEYEMAENTGTADTPGTAQSPTIVGDVIARLTGERWYQDTRTADKVLGLPYYVVEGNGLGYHVDTKGRRHRGEMMMQHGHVSEGYVVCARPTFPGDDGTIHYLLK